MPIREILPFTDDGDGLDFGEFWNDPDLVGAAIRRLLVALQPCIGYCFRLHAVHDGISWFEPYGTTGLVSVPTITLPAKVKYSRLLIQEPNQERWPILGQWTEGISTTLHPSAIKDSCHIQIRLKSGKTYVGYFKLALNRKLPPEDDEVRVAFRDVKLWLDATIASRERANIWSTPSAVSALASTHEDIEHDIKTGRPKAAIQRLASLLTSHIGSAMNRAILLWPTADDALSCIYAHGGDCSDEWAARIQAGLAHNVRSFSALQGQVSLEMPPISDPLYRDLAGGNPLRLKDVSTSKHLIAQIWRRGGSLEWIPHENAVEDEPPVIRELSDGGMLVSASPMYNIAARFDFNDSWLAEVRNECVDSSFFLNKNGTVFALTWFWERTPLGIWLFDLGAWSRFDLRHDIVPRLKAAKIILEQFSQHFVGLTI
ncbi:MAG TPA: hypothetical protein VGN12_06905 [Pirellulales bacterium]|jgi:hypothetical protein